MSKVHFYRDSSRHIVIAEKGKQKVGWWDRVASAVLVCIIGWIVVGLVWIALNF